MIMDNQILVESNTANLHDTSHRSDPVDHEMKELPASMQSVPVTTLETIRNPSVKKEFPLGTVLNQIQYPETINEKFKIYRGHLVEHGKKDERTIAAKNNLPCISFSGTYQDKVVNDNFAQSSGIFLVDIDNVDPTLTKEKLAKLPHTIFAFISPSETGVKAGIRVDPTLITSDQDFKKVYQCIEHWLASLSITIDSACKDVRRLCFISLDPDMYINYEAEPIDYNALQAQFKQDSPFPSRSIASDNPSTLVPTGGYTQAYCDNIIEQQVSIIRATPEGKRHKQLLNSSLTLFGLADKSKFLNTNKLKAELLDAGTNIGLPIDEVKTVLRDADKHIRRTNQSNHETANQNNTSKFKLVSIASLIKNPKAVDFMVKGLIESGGMNLISGEYGSGKTFLVFDLAFCVASGIDWHGHKVKQSPVVIIAGEGHQGIGNRLLALEQHYNSPTPLDELRISVSKVAANFTDGANAQLVQQAVQEVCPDGEDGLVIIDTLNRNFGSANENETAQMTKFVNNLDTYFRNPGKTVIVVHHPNKSDPNSSRGSNALPSACEGVFNLKKDLHGQIEFWCSKQKNAKETPTRDKGMFFELEAVTFPNVFEEGEPVGSAVLVLTDKPIKSEKKYRPTANESECINSLSYLVKNKSEPVSEDIKKRYSGLHHESQRMVQQDHWRDECYKRMNVNSDKQDAKLYKEAQRKAFSRARDKLVKESIIVTFDSYVWFLGES
jgi:hypothetical protein